MVALGGAGQGFKTCLKNDLLSTLLSSNRRRSSSRSGRVLAGPATSMDSSLRTRGSWRPDRPAMAPHGIAWQNKSGAASMHSPMALASPRPSSAMGGSFSVTAARFGYPAQNGYVEPRSPDAIRTLGHQRFGWKASRLSEMEPVAFSSGPRPHRPVFRGTLTGDYRLGDTPYSAREPRYREQVPMSFSNLRSVMYDIKPGKTSRTVDYFQ